LGGIRGDVRLEDVWFRYAPGALVRHQHRGSSGVWSGRFVYYTERNRLLLLIKLAPADRVLLRLGRSFGAAILATLAAAAVVEVSLAAVRVTGRGPPAGVSPESAFMPSAARARGGASWRQSDSAPWR